MTQSNYFDLEQRLVAALQQEAGIAMTTTDTSRELQRWNERQHKHKNRMRIGLIAAAAAAVAAIVLGITLGWNGSDNSRSEPIHKPVPVPTVPTTVTLNHLAPLSAPGQVTTTKGPVNPGSVAFGVVWATGLEQSGRNLYRLDPNSGSILSSTKFRPSTTVTPVPTRVGDRIVVASSSGYAVFNHNATRVGTIRTQLPGVIAGDASGGWVQLDSTTLGRLDADATTVTQRIPVAPNDSGTFIHGVAVVNDSLYVATSTPNALSRIDPATGKAVTSLTLDATPASIVATGSAVYVATESYKLLRVDSQLSAVTAISDNAVRLGSFFLPFLGPGDSLWVTPNHGGIVELDPTTLKPLRSFRLRGNQDPGWNFGGAVTPHRVFVGSVRTGGTLSIPID